MMLTKAWQVLIKQLKCKWLMLKCWTYFIFTPNLSAEYYYYSHDTVGKAVAIVTFKNFLKNADSKW